MLAHQRHKRILGRQAKLAGVIWGVVLSITTLLGGVQTFQNHQAQASVASAEKRSNFWRIISGDEAPSSTRVNDTFATTLRDDLGKIDPSATSLPKEITDFRAGVNEYGGIQSELGFNPFDGTGQSCDVCGGLSTEMRDKLLLIKQGRVDQVIQSEVTANQPQGYSLAPAGLPLIAWFGMVYLGAGTFALIMAVRKDCLENDYTSAELDWSTNTGFTEDRLKKFSKAISPGYFLVALPLMKKRGDDYEGLVDRIGMTDDVKELKELLRAVDALPEQEREATRAQLEKLYEEILMQVRNNVGSDRVFVESEADEIRQRVQMAIDKISLTLEVRSDVLNERPDRDHASAMKEIEAALQTDASPTAESQPERRQQPG